MRTAAATRPDWVFARGRVALDRPVLLGILNLTPDSFWEGGRHGAPEAALRHAERLVAEGADLLDVGGESTRPGARPVSPDEEAGRVVPVILALAERFPDTPISVDTVKAGVARAAMEAGASIINDVSGLRLDDAMGEVVAETGAGLVLMHSRGTVEQMAGYELAEYGDDPVGEIVAELSASVEKAEKAGIAPERIVVDPGLGFAKRTEHSVAALRELDRIEALGRPVLVGPSRKRFVGELAGGLEAVDRLEGTIAACVAAWLNGARLFRVHDVRAIRRALAVAAAVGDAT